MNLILSVLPSQLFTRTQEQRKSLHTLQPIRSVKHKTDSELDLISE